MSKPRQTTKELQDCPQHFLMLKYILITPDALLMLQKKKKQKKKTKKKRDYFP